MGDKKEQFRDFVALTERWGRQKMCEYLDVAPSTLSTWLKKGEAPKMALEAVSRMAPRVTAGGRKKLQENDLTDSNMEILEENGVYRICRFSKKNGVRSGEVVADNIRERSVAEIFMKGWTLLNLGDHFWSLNSAFEMWQNFWLDMYDCEELINEDSGNGRHFRDFLRAWKAFDDLIGEGGFPTHGGHWSSILERTRESDKIAEDEGLGAGEANGAEAEPVQPESVQAETTPQPIKSGE